MDEVTEIYAPPPTTTTSRTLTAQTPMPTSPIGRSDAHSVRSNSRDLTATPTRPSDETVEAAEGGKVHGNGEGLIGFRVGTGENENTVSFKEKSNNVQWSSRTRTAKRVEKMGGIEYS